MSKHTEGWRNFCVITVRQKKIAWFSFLFLVQALSWVFTALTGEPRTYLQVLNTRAIVLLSYCLLGVYYIFFGKEDKALVFGISAVIGLIFILAALQEQFQAPVLLGIALGSVFLSPLVIHKL